MPDDGGAPVDWPLSDEGLVALQGLHDHLVALGEHVGTWEQGPASVYRRSITLTVRTTNDLDKVGLGTDFAAMLGRGPGLLSDAVAHLLAAAAREVALTAALAQLADVTRRACPSIAAPNMGDDVDDPWRAWDAAADGALARALALLGQADVAGGSDG